MISTIGHILILGSLLVAVLGAFLGFVSAKKGSERGALQTRRMAYLFSAMMIGAMFLMEYALLTNDFSVSYVAEVGSLETPRLISFVSLWSSLDGSILFWGAVLGAYTMVFARQSRNKPLDQGTWSLAVLMSIGLFFAFLIASVANPFEASQLPVPTNGPGPNPMLQNHALMIIHPPTLYLGFVGMSVPFAIGSGALLSGRLDSAWLRYLRRWSLVVWGFLTLGILLGAWWSYEVLGWGGYWAWDPVENGSFLPWLTLTAFLHSAMVTSKRNAFAGWSLVLVMVSFILTLLGTFLTRSSVLESVHNFTSAGIGPTFFAAIVISLLFTIILLSFRMERLVPDPKPIAMVSRESAFLLNNMLFVAFTFTVLVGTLFPLVVEAVNDERISMGRPFFDSVSVPICVALIFLMGIGPVLPWGRPTAEVMKRRLAMPFAVALSVGLGVFVWGMRSGWGIAAFSLAAMAMSVSLREMILPGLARRAAGEPMFTALFNGAKSSRRRFAGHIVHIGVALAAVGISASSIYREDVRVLLPIDEPVDVLGYTLEFKELKEVSEPHLTAEVAVVDVSRDGVDLGQLEPRNNQYFMMVNGMAMPRDEMPTPAVRSGLDEDLYLTILSTGPDSEGRDSVTMRVIIEPLMAWLWYGGLLMVLGSFIAAYPSKKNGTA